MENSKNITSPTSKARLAPATYTEGSRARFRTEGLELASRCGALQRQSERRWILLQSTVTRSDTLLFSRKNATPDAIQPLSPLPADTGMRRRVWKDSQTRS